MSTINGAVVFAHFANSCVPTKLKHSPGDDNMSTEVAVAAVKWVSQLFCLFMFGALLNYVHAAGTFALCFQLFNCGLFVKLQKTLCGFVNLSHHDGGDGDCRELVCFSE